MVRPGPFCGKFKYSACETNSLVLSYGALARVQVVLRTLCDECGLDCCTLASYSTFNYL